MKDRCVFQLLHLTCSAQIRSEAVYVGGLESGKEQVKATVPMCTSLLQFLCADLRLSEAPEP